MTAGSQHHYALPASLDISSAEALLEQLRTYPASDSLALDAESVERLTTPCAQILLSAHQTAVAAGGKLTINNASETFSKALQHLDIASILLGDETSS